MITMTSILKRTGHVHELRSLTSSLIRRSFSSVIKCDALVLGCGIGGASTSYQLAKLHNLNVICLERENAPGNHSTGKAFGIFAESNARSTQTKLMTAASRPFFESPDEECIDDYIRENFQEGILEKTGLVAISSPNDYAFLYKEFGPSEKLKYTQNIEVLTQTEAMRIVPFLRKEELADKVIYEPDAANFNTGLVYEHYLVGGNTVGVEYYFDQNVMEMSKNNRGNWEVLCYNEETNNNDTFEAGIVINCTGQWADDTAKKAGIKPINLVTHKRNVIVFTFDKDLDKEFSFQQLHRGQTPWLGWISSHSTDVFHSSFQGKNGIFLYDKAYEEGVDGIYDTTMDEMEIAQCKIDRYTSLKVDKLASKAAGIKCSIEQDKNMVIGPSKEDASFIWCAALSSYGIQTAPAYSEIISYLAVNKDLPNTYIDLDIDLNELLPSRIQQ